jgi:hypothetical protein
MLADNPGISRGLPASDPADGFADLAARAGNAKAAAAINPITRRPMKKPAIGGPSH